MTSETLAGGRPGSSSAFAILRHLVSDPVNQLLLRWNWKAALPSALLRAHIFLAANATAGWRRALWAAGAEFLFRLAASGFYGSLTQAFRAAEPAWTGALAVMVMLPLISHSMEFTLHALRGTPHLKASIISSVIFTFWSTAFNWFAMRRGALLVGRGQASLANDLARVPRLLVEFFQAIGRFPGRVVAQHFLKIMF